MLIADIHDPQFMGNKSAEESILANNLKDLYDEIKRIIFDTRITISPLKTVTRKGGTTGAIDLAPSLNDALEIGLKSCDWHPFRSPGGTDPKNMIDWYKSKPSGRTYGPTELGIGLEIQFGNNYQFNEDIKRLSEAYFAGYIVAGVSIVASDNLSEYKADRGAFFSDAKNKLDRHLETLAAAQAQRFPPIVIIGVHQDAFNEDPYGMWEIIPVQVANDDKGILVSTLQPMMTNANHPAIIKRRRTGEVTAGDIDERET